MSFIVSMPEPASHYYQVEFTVKNLIRDTLVVKMPEWMPGYYQIMHYAANVENFKAVGKSGNEFKSQKSGASSWNIVTKNATSVTIRYSVKATTSFVASSYLDADHGYISPAGVFIYVDGALNYPVSLTLKLPLAWTRTATGLDSVAGKSNQYTAPDFDQLYDSPILMGKLEELRPFKIRGITHRFIGLNLGNFDRVTFMKELAQAVEAGVNIIDDIPYKHYTFIAIGPGRGGIEHLNSTSFGFDGNDLNTAGGRLRMLNFLSHEYFHHYNIKRIRPVELGPFDYQKENRTNSLWVSEGLSVYYEYMMVARAGLTTTEALLTGFQNNAASYENKSGHLFQSLVQSSYDTWSDGPFGRSGDEVNKTISYYDKGPVMGLLLDFEIRHATANKKSLDDVMRMLYTEYYQQKKRGFSDAELQQVCETVAGKSLTEFFEYIYTAKEVNYNKYLAFGGLMTDTTPAAVSGGWLGVSTRQKSDSLFITGLDWQSPALRAGLHSKNVIVEVNGIKATKKKLEETLLGARADDHIKLQVLANGVIKEFDVILGTKLSASFKFTMLSNPDDLQQAIFKSWLGK